MQRLVAAAVLVVVPVPALHAKPRTALERKPRYRMVLLPELPGGDYSMARAINNKGQVVGLSSTGGSIVHGLLRDTRAVLWEGGRVRDLIGTSQASPEAFAINDRGQILIHPQYIGGNRSGSVPPPNPYVVEWDRGTSRFWHDVQGFQPRSMNDRGKFAGEIGDEAAQQTTGDAVKLTLPFQHERSCAYTVSDQSLIGGSYQHGSITRGFIAYRGKVTDPAPWAEEVFWGFTASNARGEAAEAARDKQWRTHLLLWRDGRVRDLGSLGRWGSIAGLNSSDEIVGDAMGKPFLYVGGRIYRLSDLVVGRKIRLAEIGGINDAGQIAATAEVGNRAMAVRLDPIRE